MKIERWPKHTGPGRIACRSGASRSNSQDLWIVVSRDLLITSWLGGSFDQLAV